MAVKPITPNLRPVNRPQYFMAARTISALILREMTTSYGRSPGGYLWALAEPVLGVALLSAIFSIGFRNPMLGTNFAMFYATGLLPFLMFNDLSTKIAQAINYSKQLLAYPRVTFIDAIAGRFILNFLTQMLVCVIVFSGITLIFETRTTLEWKPIMSALSMTACFGLGLGTFNCFLMSMFPIWQRMYSILTRPLLLISGVIFTFEAVPQPYQDWLWYNPLVHITGTVRAGLYNGYHATYANPIYVYAVSILLCFFGLVFLRRYHRDIMEL
ncbi:capsular polysaccharide transport system permease protein [Sulfitobacter marinus]|uniref:Transport permease protein n=1 Tax=Sulfitobacter marinus TaxID=394264 RepID=A0A1I6T9J6_9RHOB|nr:ABC transporter permease [Sulfitobacter marinus]SFS85860.1 capsular polysaccharide transport system permease protein [Sulfitobacter marinus]